MRRLIWEVHDYSNSHGGMKHSAIFGIAHTEFVTHSS
jgi:hypothetical protein